MFNKHPSDSHVQVRAGNPIFIRFLIRRLKSGSLKPRQYPHLMEGRDVGKWEAIFKFKEACVWWRSQILPSFFSRLGQGEAACWGG